MRAHCQIELEGGFEEDGSSWWPVKQLESPQRPRRTGHIAQESAPISQLQVIKRAKLLELPIQEWLSDRLRAIL